MFEDLSGLCKINPHLSAYRFGRSFWKDGKWLLPTRKARVYPCGGEWAADCVDAIRPGYGATPAAAFKAMLTHCSDKARRDFLFVTPI